MAILKAKKRHAPIIAIVGSDGSGKTTVSNELLAFMSTYHPTRLCHLGKQTGNFRRAMRKYAVGQKVDSKIKKVGASARQKGLSFPVAFVMFMVSMRRVFRFSKMCIYHILGRAVLTDRYPQVAVAKIMDGPLLPGRELADRGAKLLMKIESWLYNKMLSIQPDLVIRLNVSLETAIERKPDHGILSLGRKIEAVPLLSFNGAPIVDLDSEEPLNQVVEQAKQAVSLVMNRYYPTHQARQHNAK